MEKSRAASGGIAGWAAVVLAALGLLYLAGSGPAWYAVRRGWIDPSVHRRAYEPLGRAFGWRGSYRDYVGWWNAAAGVHNQQAKRR